MNKYIVIICISIIYITSCINYECKYGGKEMEPLSADYKNRIGKMTDYDEISGILGNPQQIEGSGISYSIWYFNDNTALAVAHLSKAHYEMLWHRTKPFQLNFQKLGMPNEKYKYIQ